jgi:hypothetical protein
MNILILYCCFDLTKYRMNFTKPHFIHSIRTSFIELFTCHYISELRWNTSMTFIVTILFKKTTQNQFKENELDILVDMKDNVPTWKQSK